MLFQGCQIFFLTPNFTHLVFLEAVSVKEIVWLFGLYSFQYLTFLGSSWQILQYQTGVLAF